MTLYTDWKTVEVPHPGRSDGTMLFVCSEEKAEKTRATPALMDRDWKDTMAIHPLKRGVTPNTATSPPYSKYTKHDGFQQAYFALERHAQYIADLMNAVSAARMENLQQDA